MHKHIIVFLLLHSLLLSSQNTFNQRLDLGFKACTLGSVEVNDSIIYASGGMLDSVTQSTQGYFILKLNLAGEILSSNKIVIEDATMFIDKHFLKETINGNLVNLGLVADSTGLYLNLLEHDSEGDILNQNMFYSPFYPLNGFLSHQGLLFGEEEESTIIASSASNNSGATHTWIFETTSDGLIYWDTVLVNSQGLNQVPFGLNSEINGALVVTGSINNNNFNNTNFTYQIFIKKFNQDKEVIWEYLSPIEELLYPANNVLVTEDGYVLGAGKGVIHVNGQAGYVAWRNYVYKIDDEGEFQWGVDLGNINTLSGRPISRIIEASDQSGYIAIGLYHEINEEETAMNNYGFIAKITPEGDSLWTRYYLIVDSPVDRHIFNDIVESPDGGFVMVGEARDLLNSAPLPRQQAWIVKVDQQGCLVPGCDLVDDAEEPIVDFQLSMYPNPTIDYLNIFFYDPHWIGAVDYEVRDISGRLLKSFQATQNNITHILPVHDLSSGIYYLSCSRKGILLVTEEFVVTR